MQLSEDFSGNSQHHSDNDDHLTAVRLSFPRVQERKSLKVTRIGPLFPNSASQGLSFTVRHHPDNDGQSTRGCLVTCNGDVQLRSMLFMQHCTVMNNAKCEVVFWDGLNNVICIKSLALSFHH